MRDRTFPQIEHRVFREGQQYVFLTFAARCMSDDEIGALVAKEILSEHPRVTPVRWKDIPRDIRELMRREALHVTKRDNAEGN